MSGRKVADRPDPEWVATLKEGDAVAVAHVGQEIYVSNMRRVTPGGLVRVGSASTPVRLAPTFKRDGYSVDGRKPGWRPRYLVPVASSPDKEGA